MDGSAISGRVPAWVVCRRDGQTCKGCGSAIARGASARYDFDSQNYPACMGCADGPAPIRQSAATVAALEAVPLESTAAPAPLECAATVEPAPRRGGLLAELERFASRNAPDGADIPAMVDRMLAAITRAALAES